MAATALSQPTETRQKIREEREANYLRIASKYDAEELDKFGACLGETVLELEEDPRDVLGVTFQELELSNKWRGQFFTPMSISELMAQTQIDPTEVSKKEYVTISDPAIGSGSLLIGVYRHLRHHKLQRKMLVFGQDLDSNAIFMSYIQLSLLGIPGILVQGNTLSDPATLKDYLGSGERPESVWYTPMWVRGGWNRIFHKSQDDFSEELDPMNVLFGIDPV